MQADDWWTHGGGETSSQVIYEDTMDQDENSGGGGDGRASRQYSRWRLPISDDVDYDYYYYYYYYDTQLYDSYDYASGSGASDVGKFCDLLSVFKSTKSNICKAPLKQSPHRRLLYKRDFIKSQV